MNRRLFLLQPAFLTASNKSKKITPVSTKQINSNDTVFVSENGKLTIQSIYDDYGTCVAVTNAIEWDDPVTNTTMKTLNRELYILESDQM
jgi:hypothetical protein